MIRRSCVIAGAILAAAIGLPACDGSSQLDQPPDIAYGSDVCAACSMIISDERYAGALIVQRESGEAESLRFDDAGEMIAYEAARPELTILRRWVKDARTRDWLDAADAWLIRSPALHTPMGTGVAAADTREQAQALAQEAGDADAAPARYADKVQQAREQRTTGKTEENRGR